MPSQISMLDKISSLVVGAVAGPNLSDEERAFFDEYSLAGITLFRRNIPAQYEDIRQLCEELQTLAAQQGAAPMIIAIDQEGGRVRRIREPFPDIGPNLSAFASPLQPEDLSYASNYGLVSGLCLSGVGINVNFAPVVDIYHEDADPSIGDRCYSSDPETVAKLGGAYLTGLHKGGVASCLKHFPGQGQGKADTHLEGTVIAAAEDDLAGDLAPFAQLADQTPLVMVSHAVYPALDPKHKASCSKTIITDILRGRLGFDGVVLSDDVNMKAFDESAAKYGENIIASIKAGVDGILVCEGLTKMQRTIEAISAAVDAGDEQLAARVSESHQRLAMFRASLAPLG